MGNTASGFMGKIARTLTRFICIFLPIKKNKVVFDNFAGKGYGDSPKYIAEELLSCGLDLDLVWLTLDSDIVLPNGIRKVKYKSLSSIVEAATAKVWVDNVRAAHLIRKKKKQVYLQTWHGSFSPKKIEKDAEDQLLPVYVKKAKMDGMIIDAIISNSYLLDEQYLRTFWLSKNVEILKIGLPRNDIYFKFAFHAEINNKIRSKYQIDDDYLILYAPTFRDNGSVTGYDIPYEEVRKAFESAVGKSCKLLIRFHPNVKIECFSLEYSDRIINVTDYPDLQELVITSDAVISDYSTTVFDFAMMKKPVFLHALDIEEYNSMRGLLDEYYELPFPHTYSNDDLLLTISRFTYSEYINHMTAYFQKKPTYDSGNASNQAADWIIKKLQL